jgi:hypothetical protein
VILSKCYSHIACLIPKANPKHMDLPRAQCVTSAHCTATAELCYMQHSASSEAVAAQLTFCTQFKTSCSLVCLKKERRGGGHEAVILFLNKYHVSGPVFVVKRSEFLPTDPEVPGTIPGPTRFSE